MVKYVIGYLLLVLSLNSLAQEVKEIKYDKEYEINPEPNKGIDHFKKYLEKEVDIPLSLIARLKEGSVLFSINLSQLGQLNAVHFENFLSDEILKENINKVIHKYFESDVWKSAVLNGDSQSSLIHIVLAIRPKPKTGYYRTSVMVQVVDKPSDIWFVEGKPPVMLKSLIKKLTRSIPEFETQTTLIYEIDESGNLLRFDAETDSRYAVLLSEKINDKLKGKKW
ncbi:hypothetical protein EDC17_102321 [Sphingobacterium alimentarium]|uniref:Uncharacterized protein n=1 Tax=Sphingobacterium alimentarium TaxID=797292 RepID=A0A4R3VVG3_9SPHI|nr:hypothetical protein [Sphingobacterium alimentarium]TCV12571.1 hypothetical protein EDC17_102321 [Sphingobacterium alimentarium]